MAVHEDGGPKLVAITGVLLVLATVSVAARCYSQIVLMKRFQIEDWLAILTWAVYATFTGICATGVYYGLGKAVADVPAADRLTAVFYKYIGMTIYVLCSGLIKFVVGIYLIKIFSSSHQKWQTRLLYTLLVIVGVINTAYFFISIFQCAPIKRFWLQYDPDWPKEGRCLKTWFALASTYTVNIVNIIADAILAILPITLVWNAKMDRRTKISVVSILAVGSAASVCTIIRVPYVYQLLASKEYLANFIDLSIWSAIEIGLALVASSAATLRPLFKKMKILSQSATFERSTHKRTRSTFHSRARGLQLFIGKKKPDDSFPASQQTPRSGRRLLGSFGTTYGTDTKVSFGKSNGRLDTKKSYATLGGDTLNDTAIRDDDYPSPIHVRTTITVDVEKGLANGAGDDGDHFQSSAHPRYHAPLETKERLMWEKREKQEHQYHINTRIGGKTLEQELEDLENFTMGGPPDPARLPNSPPSPFPMVSPTSTLSPGSPRSGSQLFLHPTVYSPMDQSPTSSGQPDSPSPSESPDFPSPSDSPDTPILLITPEDEPQIPQPAHKPAAAQGRLLPEPVQRENEIRRLSCPV